MTKTWIIRPPGEVGSSSLGGALRARYVATDNALGLGSETDPEYQFFALRTRITYERTLAPTVRLHAALVNESTKYVDCDVCEGGVDEIVFEHLYLEWIRPRGLRLALRVGRQDLLYGDGFLIADGGPGDGTRTTYVNGAVLTGGIPLWDFDVFVASNSERDEYLPRINSKRTMLVENDEALAGIVLRRSGPGGGRDYTLEPYYLYKSERGPGRRAWIHTLGGRLSFGTERGGLTTEFAYQTGQVPEKPDSLRLPDEPTGPQTISALGGQASLGTQVRMGLPVEIRAGYVWLSGDDHRTRNKFEGWNPILGRWPKWSQLYVYTLSLESSNQPMFQEQAYWQNLASPFIQLTVAPGAALRCEAAYFLLSAVEDLDFDLSADQSRDRGKLLTLGLSWRHPRLFDGHLLYERFKPGGFYRDLAEDLGTGAQNASYLRLEFSRSF